MSKYLGRDSKSKNGFNHFKLDWMKTLIEIIPTSVSIYVPNA